MSSTNKLFWLPRFERDYKKLPPAEKERVNKSLVKMEKDLRYPSLFIKKMKGTANIWEARASDSLRITFSLEGNGIYLRTVGQHDILKNP
jgi:mRNA-degrading endonuclease RelE of RelBE toxin-antitoxin system